jgi:hypothetical protein
MQDNMKDLLDLVKGYRRFLIELGIYFEAAENEEWYLGFEDTYIDMLKSPEIGFTKSEVDTLRKMFHKFGLLDINDLPSHNAMKLMANKDVDMDLLESAQTLHLTDFKESLKDKELGTQDRTYHYEVIKRTNETGSIKRVYGDEIKEALKQIQDEQN